MGIIFTLNALKFYKLRSTVALRVSFVLLLAMRLLLAFLPFGDRDFSRLMEAVRSGSASLYNLSELLSIGNWQQIAAHALILVIAYFFALFYAQCLVFEESLYRQTSTETEGADFLTGMRQVLSELPSRLEDLKQERTKRSENRADTHKDRNESYIWQEPQVIKEREQNVNSYAERRSAKHGGQSERHSPAMSSLKVLLKHSPQQLLLIVAVFLMMPLTASFLFIPLLIILFNYFLAPLNSMLDGDSLAQSLSRSRKQTLHLKFGLFIQFASLILLIDFPLNILLTVFETSYYSSLLIDAFFFCVKTFMLGRLWGLIYLFCGLDRPELHYPTAEL